MGGTLMGQSCDVTTVYSGTCGKECIAGAGQKCSDCSSTNICCASGSCHMGGTCAAGNCIPKAGDACNDCTNSQYCTCDNAFSANANRGFEERASRRVSRYQQSSSSKCTYAPPLL